MCLLFSRVLTLSSLLRGLYEIVDVCELPIAGGDPSLLFGFGSVIAGTGTYRTGLLLSLDVFLIFLSAKSSACFPLKLTFVYEEP